MKLRDKNKILDKFPGRLKPSDNTKDERKELELRMSYNDGNQIYVEWSLDQDCSPMMSKIKQGDGLFNQTSGARIYK
jgi:hypothetical protein